MNKFQTTFFEKYVPEWQEIQAIIHEHWIRIIDNLILNLWLLVFIPTFLFYYSYAIQQAVPFYIFEIYLLLIYIKIIYDIFDWYNDVWLITDKWVIDLQWRLFNTNMKTVDFEHIEWVEIEQNWIWDTILNKWNIIVHKIWEEEFKMINASKPYIAIDEIEEKREEFLNPEDEVDKFDLVMDTLAWVIKQYMWKNKNINNKQEIQNNQDYEENIENKLDTIKEKEWTIDLR